MAASDPLTLFQELKNVLAAKDRAGSNRIILKLIELRPKLGRHWKSLAAIAKTNGEVSAANLAMTYYADDSGNTPGAQYERAAILAQTGRVTEADAVMQALPEHIPSKAENAYIRGTLAANLGRTDIARSQLLRAANANPLSGHSWLALAMMGELDEIATSAFNAARAAIMERPSAPAEQAAYLYGAGKLHADSGEHAAAFSEFTEGARLIRAQRPYSPARDAASANSAIVGWTAERIAKIGNSGSIRSPARPIFVTGLPRSGTTLVEQILASHSTVDGGEELGLFRVLEQDIGGKAYDDFSHYTDNGGTADDLRALYEHLLAERYPGAGRVIDKTLNTSRYIGLIASLFPDAPIIWIRRDPLDCAWSAYRTWFLSGIDWSWSLPDIAAHFKLEDDLFDHWTALLGDRIYRVDYATLVTQPDAEIEKLVTYCGLDLEAGQLTPHETSRVVSTASFSQVREPINQKGIGSAKPYAELMREFTDAYFD